MPSGTSGVTRPAAVAFDIFGTLFELDPLGARLESAGLPKQSLKLWFSRMLRDAFACEAAGTFRNFREVAAGALQVLLIENGAITDQKQIDHVLDGFSELQPRKDVESAFRKLQEAKVPIATLGNGSASTVRQLLERSGLLKYVRHVLSIEEVKHWKPHREPYLFAARTMQVEPNRLALIAAHAWDTHGAHEAGLITGWISVLEKRYQPAFDPPDVSGASLEEVVAALVSER
jgi:2-haloacid dehalogenase